MNRQSSSSRTLRWARRLVVLLAVAAAAPAALQGQEEETGRINVQIRLVDVDLAPAPAMVSFIQNGEIVAQHEVLLETSGYGTGATTNSGSIPTGLYDVRIEGEGVTTEVKRGVRNYPTGQPALHLNFLVRAGQGLHVVEYSTGGLAREEVAARLSRLETIVERNPDLLETADLRDPEGADPCCDVTAVDAATGVVTAIEPRSGRTFQFQVTDAALLGSVQVGQRVWADFDTGRVGLAVGEPCCLIRGR